MISQNLLVLELVPRRWRDPVDAAVQMHFVVPINKLADPLACRFDTLKPATERVAGAVLESLKQRLRERIIVRHFWSAERLRDTEPFKRCAHRSTLHRATII